MEIWIASGNRKELKKIHPFLRDYGIIDVKEIASHLGYATSVGLDEHASFILNDEIKKRILAFNFSKRFYRVLFLIEEHRLDLPEDLLEYSVSNKLKYETIYVREEGEFRLACKNY